jgi:hypothetical protein
VTNRGKWRHSAAVSEFGAVFLNGLQRSVNRKVQGSNPWSGATELEVGLNATRVTDAVQQPYSNAAQTLALNRPVVAVRLISISFGV